VVVSGDKLFRENFTLWEFARIPKPKFCLFILLGDPMLHWEMSIVNCLGETFRGGGIVWGIFLMEGGGFSAEDILHGRKFPLRGGGFP